MQQYLRNEQLSRGFSFVSIFFFNRRYRGNESREVQWLASLFQCSFQTHNDVYQQTRLTKSVYDSRETLSVGVTDYFIKIWEKGEGKTQTTRLLGKSET